MTKTDPSTSANTSDSNDSNNTTTRTLEDKNNSFGGRDIFTSTFVGAQDRPYIPRIRSDPPYHPFPQTLRKFREDEGEDERQTRLYALWKRLPKTASTFHLLDTDAEKIIVHEDADLTPERAARLKDMYETELRGKCGVQVLGQNLTISWHEFQRYADAKEVELWKIFHDELDLDGNGHLDAEELAIALQKADIKMTPSTLSEFMTFFTSSNHSHAITFPEFRDFLLLLPRKVSTAEIYRWYEVRKFLGDDGRGAARVTMDGDVSLSGEDRPHPPHTILGNMSSQHEHSYQDDNLPVDHTVLVEHDEGGAMHEEAKKDNWIGGSTASRFLLAGGIAGAVSRTCTAPFDRLKIFLITRSPESGGAALRGHPSEGAKAIGNAIRRIYAEGGVLAFWTGNGLSCLKIFPESAIKFFSYEASKRFFARYWDNVEDSRDISGTSRFIAGGIGGITSQLSIYPLETLKTQMMSNKGERNLSLVVSAKRLWQLGGMRAYYRGLAIGLLGVFPYSAIDMSTFEALKLAYLRSTGKDEPPVYALLAFGSVSGSVGATSVYPLNMVRTRLQASGSSGHPERYTGMWDVVGKTYERDGWRGFYRGLFPTLAKVVPAVSISYVVYEHSKRRLGV